MNRPLGTSSSLDARRDVGPQPGAPDPADRDCGLARLLDLALVLAGVAAVACALTLAVPGLLSGPAVMNGSARGTALVALCAAVPTLLGGVWWARGGATGGMVAVAGAAAYLVYNGFLLVFATPFNEAFLWYVATLGLALWTMVGLCLELWVRTTRLRADPPRWVAVYLWVVVALNALVWLARIVPALFDEHPTSMLAGTGLTTNPVYVQDLAFWLPAISWLAVGVWRRHPPRVALATAATVFWAIEALGVAVDQWMGHRADPVSEVASLTVVPAFLALAVIGLWPLLRLLPTLPAQVLPAPRRTVHHAE